MFYHGVWLTYWFLWCWNLSREFLTLRKQRKLGSRLKVKPVEVLLILGNEQLLGCQHVSHPLVLDHVGVGQHHLCLHHDSFILAWTQSEVNWTLDAEITGKVTNFSSSHKNTVSLRTVKLLGMPGLVWLHTNKWDLLIHLEESSVIQSWASKVPPVQFCS